VRDESTLDERDRGARAFSIRAIRALSWNNLQLDDVDRYHRQMALIPALVAERPVALPPGKGSAIMASEFAHLTQADQHIAGAKERIVRQQQLIEHLSASGHSVRDAEGFLSALTGVLSAFESHRRLILNQLRP